MTCPVNVRNNPFRAEITETVVKSLSQLSRTLRFHGDDCSIFMIEFENQNFGEFIDPNSAAGAALNADAAAATPSPAV